ncbi:MAG TPA: hypothetical protein VGO47_08560 [Chlamydiales bacterium]|nr:hypothetical protein [Chlamydiales bacterium]
MAFTKMVDTWPKMIEGFELRPKLLGPFGLCYVFYWLSALEIPYLSPYLSFPIFPIRPGTQNTHALKEGILVVDYIMFDRSTEHPKHEKVACTGITLNSPAFFVQFQDSRTLTKTRSVSQHYLSTCTSTHFIAGVLWMMSRIEQSESGISNCRHFYSTKTLHMILKNPNADFSKDMY